MGDAVKMLLPEFFDDEPLTSEDLPKAEVEADLQLMSEELSSAKVTEELRSAKVAEESAEAPGEHAESCSPSETAEIKLLRIQGIEPKLEIPFTWVVNNLMNPDHFLHICIYVRVPELLAV